MEPAPPGRFVEALQKASDKIKALLEANAALKAQGAIAVIGMGCRFPGQANDPRQFWDLLAQERDAVRPIPPSRFDIDRWWSADPNTTGRMYAREAALLTDVQGFDPAFFKITPAEAEALDPQQRLLLEVSWETFENAGLDVRRLRGSRTGVYIGLSNYDYIQAHIHSGDASRITPHAGSGVMFGTASGRLSYFYDLHGPCLTLDTACSSSLVALDMAIKALRRRDCDAALAGGVSLLLSPTAMVALCKVRALAADGRSRAFDDAAAGYGRGEGCGLILLKRLEDAVRDGDHVQAVLAGSAVNHDGSSNGLTAPNGVAQQAVIRAALDDAGLTPDYIDYIETHGTGTPLGDPIEYGALRNVFGTRAERELLLGSVKTNIGHAEAAAGIAGVIKTILALRHKLVPRSLHFSTPNKHIDWSAAAIRVASAAVPWPTGIKPRAAGVSAFGLSGTNAHIIICEPPPTKSDKARPTAITPRSFHALPLSAATAPALQAALIRWRDRLATATDTEVTALCAAAARRTPLNERFVAIATDAQGLVQALNDGLPALSPTNSHRGGAPVFLFPGTESSNALGRELYETEAVFRAAYDHCAEIASTFGRTLTLGTVPNNAGSSLSASTKAANIFALQWAHAALWASWGVRPSAVAGDGCGEYAAAAVAGVFEPKIALHFILDGGKKPTDFRSEEKADSFLAKLPIYSGATGSRLAPRMRLDAAYWQNHAQSPSRFDAAMEAMRGDGHSCFLNIGPDVSLTPLATRAGAEILLSPLQSGADDARHAVEAAATLWRSGVDIDWPALCGAWEAVDAPLYPFQRKTYWLPVGPSGPDREPATEMQAAVTQMTPQGEDSKVTQSDMRMTTLVKTVASITGLDPNEISPTQPLMDMGFDSLMLLKLGQTIAHDYGVELKISQLFKEFRTLDSIVAYLDQHAITAPDSINRQETASSVPLSAAPAPQATVPTVEAVVSASNHTELKIVPSSTDFVSLFQQQLDAMTRVATQNLASLTALTQQQLAASSTIAPITATALPPQSAAPVTDAAPHSEPKPRLEKAKSAALPASLSVAEIRGINIVGARLTPRQQGFVEALVRKHVSRTNGSKELTQKSRAVLADWKHTLSFWGQLKEAKYPIVSAASDGARFTDVDGNIYIDVAMGMGVHFFGHKPAFIHKALERQMASGLELGTQSQLTGATAQLIADMTGTERIAFSNTGSEAVMVALRLARAATGRVKVVLFKNSYHGIFDGVLGAESDGQIVPIGLGTPDGMVEDLIVLDYGSDASLAYIRDNADSLAAVLTEPVQSRNPDLQPQRFLTALRKVTRESGTALIFDEMINGFRAAPGGAQEWFGIDADIALYGKIVGGGMPIGVIAGKAHFLDFIDGGAWSYGDRSGPTSALIYFGGTFCRNPVTLTAAHAALEHMKSEGPVLQNKVSNLTQGFCDRLNLWFEQHRVPLRAKFFSSQWRLVHLGGESKEPVELELLYLSMMTHGVYTWERRISFFSAAHGEAEANAVFDAITSSIDEIRAGGFEWSIDVYPDPQFNRLSSAQRRLFALSQRNGGQRPYHLPQAFFVDGPLDIDRLEDTFRQIIARHESLRTAFVTIGGETLAKRIAEPRFSIERGAIDTHASGQDAMASAIEHFLRPFDLGTAPLMRVTVAALSDSRYLLLADAHHIVVDGLSFDIIAAELMAAYAGHILPAPDYDLRLALDAAEAGSTGARGDANTAFWRMQLADLPLLALPQDRPRPLEQDFRGDMVIRDVSYETTARLKALGRQQGASLYMVLLAAWSGFLNRLSGQDDLAVGGVSSGRESAATARAVGMFANTLMFRLKPSAALPFRQHLSAVIETCMASYDHGDFPFESIAELAGSVPPGRNAVFDTLLSYEDANERIIEIDQLTFSRHEIQTNAAMFDLSVNAMEERGVLKLYISYATALFDHRTIECWTAAFTRMLESILDDPDRPLGLIDIQTDLDRQLLRDLNDTAADYPKEATLVDLFDAMALRHPERIALVFEDTRLSYAELDLIIDGLAGLIMSRTRPGDFVGVFLPRSHLIPVAEVAIMKAGCVFVPLDPCQPEALLSHILSDSACKLVLTEPAMQVRLPSSSHHLALDITAPRENHFSPSRRPRSSDCAYVIYTSGSTGQPKGCIVTHRNAVRLLVNSKNPFRFGPDDIWLCAHAFFFDFSIWEIWGAWTSGGCVVIANTDAIRDPDALLTLVKQQRVSVLSQTPAAFYGFIGAAVRQLIHDLAGHLHTVILGGDRLEPAYLRPWAKIYPLDKIAVVNMYGITETTVHVTFHRVAAADFARANSPIGKPLPETTIDILSPSGLPQPIGVPGEIFVGGSGVCSGYLNRPELNAERFVTIDGRRVYRSGDIGRLRADGALDYFARNDDQVQINGHRIELAGIERWLLEHPRVDKAIVTTHSGSDGRLQLVAYIVGDPDVTVAELREHLAQCLPTYAIPIYFVALQAFPLTANGKLDRKLLPSPEENRMAAGPAETAPRNALETKIAAVWAEILKVPQIGVEQNYYALGGDSIKALQIVSRLHKAGINVSLAQMLAAKTIAGLAAQASAVKTPAMVAGFDNAPLTPIQHWLLSTHGAAPDHFNNAVLLAAVSIDATTLKKAVAALVAHHDVLRLSLDLSAVPAMQRVVSALTLPIEIVSVADAAHLTAHAAAAQRQFDISLAPLLRVVLYHLPDGDRLLIICHHLVIDGVSWRILLEDLVSAYTSVQSGIEPVLQPAGLPWLEWASVQERAARSADVLAEIPYWQRNEQAAVLPLPCDFTDPVNAMADASTIVFELDAETTQRLQALAGHNETGMDAVLLAAFAFACRTCFALDRLRIRLEGHGREDFEPGVDPTRTLGWFTTIFPLLIDLSETQDFGQAIARTASALRQVPRKGAGYGVLRYLTPQTLKPHLTFGPNPELGFNYLGHFQNEMGGLFQLAPEPTGPIAGATLRRSELIDCEALINAGQLCVTLTYGRCLHARQTIEQLAQSMRAALEGSLLPNLPQALLDSIDVPAENVEAVLALSPLQEGMLFHALSGDRQSYVQQLTYRLTGPLDVDAFIAAWQQLTQRHQALRASIVARPDEAPCQVVMKTRPVPIVITDLRELPESRQAETVGALAFSARSSGFDLARDPLMRISLVRLSARTVDVIWTSHHIILDGWSIAILQDELSALYAACLNDEKQSLPPAPLLSRHLDWLAQRDKDAARRFWTTRLADAPPLSSIPGLNISGRSAGHLMTEHIFALDTAWTDALSQLAARLEVTLNSLIQGLWAILLSGYTGSDDVIFGAITSGRPADLAEMDRMIGLFLQPIPVRARMSSRCSFADLVRQLQTQANESEPFQFLSLSEMQKLQGHRHILFDHVLVFENYPFAVQGEDAILQTSHLRAVEQMHYDYSIVVHPGSCLEIKFTYNRNVLSAVEFVRIEEQMRALAEAVITNPHGPVSDLDLKIAPDLPKSPSSNADGTVIDLFEAQLARTPDNVAVKDDVHSITYRDLDARASALAADLHVAGIGPGMRVGLFLPNGMDYVASVLAICTVAGIFVPFDIEAPARRLQKLAKQIEPALFITSSSLIERLTIGLGALPSNLTIWEADGTRRNMFVASHEYPRNSAARPRPEDAAYIMFTSGSMGEPKAILSSHAALHHFIDWERAELKAESDARVANLAPVTFDVSLRDIFLPLTIGGTLCIPSSDIRRDGNRLADWLSMNAITVVHAVPSLFRLVLKALEKDARHLPALRHVLFAGELLRGADVVLARAALGSTVALRNLYGPSETTLAKCCHVVTNAIDPAKPLPVGKPLPGTRVLIVKNGRLAAPGAIGELYIEPPFTPLGYAGNPQLTAECFLPFPEEWGTGGTLYRTGDLGRELADGTIEVCGRLDGQVKINGVRVELAEIELAVLSYPEITAAVVITHMRDDGDPALVCYYSGKQSLDPAELRARLALDLPRAALPHFIVPLETFPLNLNGKIDRRALPKPDELINGRIPYVEPSGPIEDRIAKIWADVLGLRRVGACTSFFEAGGDSLRAIRLLTRINHEFDCDLSIAVFFAGPTVRELAKTIGASASATHSIPTLADAPDYPTSSAQRRLWMLEQLGGNPAAYTLPAAYWLNGPLDTEALVRALEALPSRHESLRTVFVATSDWPRQRIAPHADFHVTRIDLSHEKDPEAAAKAFAAHNALAGFDLEGGPLFSANLLTLSPSRHALLVNLHHIISDAVSVTIMVEEILRMARGETLPPLRIHYKDYTAFEAAWLETPQALAMRDWWHGKLTPPPEPLDLPFDRHPTEAPNYDGRRISICLDGEAVAHLRGLARKAGATLFSALFALAAALLQRHTDANELTLGTPVSCRDAIELENQVGFYVNLLPVRLAMPDAETAESLFARVSSALAAAIDHRAYPFDRLVKELGLASEGARHPLFDVVIVFQDGGQKQFLLDDIQIVPLEIEAKAAKFPLTFEFVETSAGVTLNLEYATALFDHDRIERLSKHFDALLKAVVANPEQPTSSFDILSVEERALLLRPGPALDLPDNATIPALFSEWVANQPHAPAVICDDVELSYAALAERSNTLAYQLTAKGVEKGDTIAVLLQRSEHLAVAFLGIMTIGAVYLPLDPGYPAERLTMMLTDSKARLVLTDGSVQVDRLRGEGRTILDIAALQAVAPADHVPAFTHPLPRPHDVAYLIYTSGSTGQPKGVLIEHRSAVNLGLAQRDLLHIEPHHRILQFAPISFDSSVWEMLMAFLNGASLVIATPACVKDPQELAAYLAARAVTVATLPPVYLAELDDKALAPLELLITAGEAPDPVRMTRLAKTLRCVNGYGPTETTVCSNIHTIDPDTVPEQSLPIGRAICNAEVLVLDRWGAPAPIGVIGEIHIGGVGLARGYLNRPAQMDAAFIPHPFKKGERLYRTGDIGKIDANGIMSFSGRRDRQVKIRGYRVELGEVERTILRYHSVSTVAVITRAHKDSPELIAFIVADGLLDIEALRRDTARTLAEFMMPSHWVVLDALPQTPSGKIDYAALSQHELSKHGSTNFGDPLEAMIGHIWRDILGHENFNRTDRFFAAGGDSIRAIQLVSRLRAAGHTIEMRAFLAAPTIADLARQLVTAPKSNQTEALPTARVDLATLDGLFSD